MIFTCIGHAKFLIELENGGIFKHAAMMAASAFLKASKKVADKELAKELADICWENLNEDNKVSLFVRQIPLDGSEPTNIIINKNK